MAPSDVQFMDNARGQWKPYRGWFGTFVENVVQGTARDLLAAAIERFEARGITVVFHCHDEVTVEVPIGILSDEEFLAILLKLPRWATGLAARRQGAFGSTLPRGAGTSGRTARHTKSRRGGARDRDRQLTSTRRVTTSVRSTIRPWSSAKMTRTTSPTWRTPSHRLSELVSLPLASGNKVSCPFHEDPEPSCTIYPDHFHCYGCGEHGSRLDWLIQVEGMTETEAVIYIKDWPGPSTPTLQNGDGQAEKLAFIKKIWTSAGRLLGSMAERYLDETRDIDITRLPEDIHRSLRFHPNCVFGPGTHLPCLIALMRDPTTDAPVGIQRIALEHRDGKIEKVDRRMLGRAGVVKLWPAWIHAGRR